MLELFFVGLIFGLLILHGIQRVLIKLLNDRIDIMGSRLNRIEERLDFYDEADTELEPTDIPQAAGEVC